MHPTPQDQSATHPVPPKRRAPSGEAFGALCHTYESYLDKAETARTELLRHYRPKSLHAWRVGLRRITATLDRVAQALGGDEPQALIEQLKVFRNATGQARDIDILLDETLPAFIAQGRFDDAWQQALETRRAELHQRAVDGLRHTPLAPSLRAFRDWREARAPMTDQALRQLGAGLIEARLHQLHKRAERLEDGRKHLHRVRTTTKKLRYTMELFQPLFPRHATRHWLDQLAELQTHLGEAHDRMTGRALCREWLPEAKGHEELKAFRRWAKRTATDSTAKAASSLEQLWGLERYWDR
ncbi:CHAD domain-containing protein [Dyella sp. OK004]|uniref:CHAD domain-containing protein n=1 Tax=Dyella sp. OK004 TaxID=1855292 RepID=UPI0008F1CF6A|nr:CHAD domain-containing protein [Dyella sp. OK004]SFS13422.1 CHAD domain-containing protein [Dyella sp. OK004]